MISVALPHRLHVSDACRHLPLERAASATRGVAPRDGMIALAEVLSISGTPALDLATGRAASLHPGDFLLVTIGRFVAPVAISAELPTGWNEVALVHRAGIAGIPSLASHREPTARLRLLGVLVDEHGNIIDLQGRSLVENASNRPLHSIGVISAARGTRAATVTAALVRAFHRTGLRTATAKPVGIPDAVERWDFRDSGAFRALDLVDAGLLCANGLETSELVGVTRSMLSELASDGADAVVVRVAGGIATPEVSALLAANVMPGLVDGVVLAATDALSAIEGARRIREVGLPLLAVSGAIVRSPLACREASRELAAPVVPIEELARPAFLQRLLSSTSLDAPASDVRLAA